MSESFWLAITFICLWAVIIVSGLEAATAIQGVMP